MAIIDDFIERYASNLEFYSETGRVCANLCELNMEQMGIRTIVSSRAKKPERLKKKLEKRNITRSYQSFEEIKEDIADFSGVRIALYFPGDLYKVQKFIESNFVIKECKTFPEEVKSTDVQVPFYKKRFSGYWATHYRVYMKASDLPENDKRYAESLIEIQVASALMLTWAEVEHDLVYKPFSGELSYEEYQILDELNGLVLAGEIALQRLQKAVKYRVSQVGSEFNNHYEVAIFLNNNLGNSIENSQNEIVLGRVDLLFSSIKSSGFNKPEKLKELLVDIDKERKDRSIVDQIMDKISDLDSALYEKYRNVKQSEELRYQMETLQMNCKDGNRQGEANTLANIGYLYSSKENYDEAITYFTKAVKINHEIGGIQGEANQLLNLGSTYRLKGDMEKALDYCNRAIRLHRKISYKQGEANTLGMMGNIFADSQNFREAYTYYQEALDIYVKTNYKIGEIIQLNNLGMLAIKQKAPDKALPFFKKALDICKKTEYKQGEGDVLHNLGNLHMEKENPTEAFICFEKALHIQDLAGNQKSSVGILISMGKAYEQMAQNNLALEKYEAALKLSNTLEYKSVEEEITGYIRRVEASLNNS